MSISVYYQPIKGKMIDIGNDGYHNIVDNIGKILKEGDLDILQGMYLATKNDSYLELIEAIKKHKRIRIYTNY